MYGGDTCETYVAEPTPTITMQNWQPWSSDCTAQCDGGRHVRVRSCVPESLHCNDIEYKECNTQPCPVWSRWSETTYSLSTMTGTRQRVCLYNGLAGISPGCEGQNTETVDYRQIPIRLGGSTDIGKGRVEIFNYEIGNWGTISDSGTWKLAAAEVVCRQLGFASAFSDVASHDATPDLTPVVSGVTCTGSESALAFCSYDSWGSIDSSFYGQDVGVTCTVDAELGKWDGWSSCSVTSRWGSRTRSRECPDVVAANGGTVCKEDMQNEKCFVLSGEIVITLCDVPIVDNGYFVGLRSDQANGSISCNEGYSPKQPNSMKCVNGDWDTAPTSCNPIPECDFPIVDNGYFIGERSHLARGWISCNEGYIPTEPNNMTCINSEWDTAHAFCNDITLCELPVVDNGYFIGGRSHLATGSISCNDGYIATEPNNMTCINNIWDTTPASCNDIDECAGPNDCVVTCANTMGSYECECPVDWHKSSVVDSCYTFLKFKWNYTWKNARTACRTIGNGTDLVVLGTLEERQDVLANVIVGDCWVGATDNV
uniref:Scavenger receptor cysteine-rich domain superfamily protein-like n=1 Tax=Saccoglossus kowalevskii TaxID=10224 RepID=A0ABM0GN04_SACKO